LLFLWSASASAADATVRESTVPTRSGALKVRCHSPPAQAEARLPLVVLLHGAAGHAPYARHYDSHAEALAASGLRTCAVLYYSAKDMRVLAGRNRAEQAKLFPNRFMGWLASIDEAVNHLGSLPTTEPESIGVLGFSQGAYLAVGLAGTNRRIKALAEFYGGFPGPLESRITQLPHTLILHGEADTVIPVQEAHTLEAMARQRATSHTTRLYPGAAHGFDLQSDHTQAIDARKQTLDFFTRHLSPARK
jgi:carboxymethylenebutenolidase